MSTIEDIRTATVNLLALIDEYTVTVPPPPPSGLLTYTVKPGDKALAHFIDSYDGKGKPVMLIWPKGTTIGRHRYDEDEEVQVKETSIINGVDKIVIASGGVRFYEIAVSPEPGVRLFLSASDGTV